ncbi:MAG: CCA tRNA nucleotidyltransferase [Tractidigestivibacter sp.]|jgi:tRNA nucleotidyltransferase (CCA-adding enzyme)|uniref:CCA tRNA nucleotidyltransferase n=1 Tax=Tractidigestivibacter sp. TaxID=2847320 RepID=UPI003D94E7E5
MNTISEQRLVGRLPKSAWTVISTLEAAGYEAWAVGGWVRDGLLGHDGHDVDVTTSAPWQKTESVLRAAGIEVHETGAKHGTVTAVVDGDPIETTTYRVEGSYSDMRHPDEVRFVTDVREDLARRDFTVNAMAWHPERGLLDPFGGRRDLEQGVIRAVGNPTERFGEDALRILRAVRFACRMCFAIEPATQQALVACAPELDLIARERVGQEMDGILKSGHAAWALRSEFDVLARAVPELAPLRGFDQRNPHHEFDLLEHTARTCEGVEEFTGGCAAQALRWAALFHDVEKPSCATEGEDGAWHYLGHPTESAKTARRVMERLAIPKGECARASALITLHDRELSASPRSVRRLLAAIERLCPGEAPQLAFELLDLMRADLLAKGVPEAERLAQVDAFELALRAELAQGATFRVKDLAVSGCDVMREAGVKPGPAVGEALRGLLDDVVAGKVPNEKGALLARLRERS